VQQGRPLAEQSADARDDLAAVQLDAGHELTARGVEFPDPPGRREHANAAAPRVTRSNGGIEITVAGP